MPRKELEWQQIPFEAIARCAGRHEVPDLMCAATGERNDMIECRRVLIEMRRTIHTALTAVPKRPFSQGLFLGDLPPK